MIKRYLNINSKGARVLTQYYVKNKLRSYSSSPSFDDNEQLKKNCAENGIVYNPNLRKIKQVKSLKNQTNIYDYLK